MKFEEVSKSDKLKIENDFQPLFFNRQYLALWFFKIEFNN